MFAFQTLVLGQEVKADDVAQDYYNQALELLKQEESDAVAPGITSATDERYLVIEIPMDYYEDYEKQAYEDKMNNLSSIKTTALDLLEKSSDLNNIDATYLLAEMNFYGNYSFPTNGSLALKYYKKVSELSENSTANFNLGFMYSTGLFGELEIDQAKANLYYDLAFQQGSLQAAMVLGYRSFFGIAVPYDCERSLYYYKVAADKAFKYFDKSEESRENFTVINEMPIIDSYAIRIGDFQGGLYGKEASETASSLYRSSSKFREYTETGVDDDFIFKAYNTALFEYEGSYLNKRDFKRAFKVINYLVSKELAHYPRLNHQEQATITKALYLLGHMYLRGEGVEQDFSKAYEYLNKSITYGKSSDGFADLGLLFKYGDGKYPKNETLATELFKYSATANNPKGLFYYGMQLKKSDDLKEREYGDNLIKRAAYSGIIEAAYHFGSKTEENINIEGTCENTVSTYKFFTESVEPVVSSLEWTFQELLKGNLKNALIGYGIAAEQGYETAQSSTAFLLYQHPSITEEPPLIPESRKQMALNYLTRSSRQFNTDSTIMMGDIYFSNKDYEKAATCYEDASARQSSHASYNLGWMHENGYGVEQDFHLAKRYYDLALTNRPKAYIPVQLALLKLRFRSFINNITGGKINGIQNDQVRTWADWKALYSKIRNSNYNFFEGNVEDNENNNNFNNNNRNEDDYDVLINQEIESDLLGELEWPDFIVLGLFFLVFAGIAYLNVTQQRRRRNGGADNANGEDNNDNRPNFQFDFRVVAI